jgi:hypothetical protein
MRAALRLVYECHRQFADHYKTTEEGRRWLEEDKLRSEAALAGLKKRFAEMGLAAQAIRDEILDKNQERHRKREEERLREEEAKLRLEAERLRLDDERRRRAEEQRAAEQQEREEGERRVAEDARLAREEDERKDRAEAERQRLEELRVGAAREAWGCRPKLARCTSVAGHYYPPHLVSDCPLCGETGADIIDADSGATTEQFIASYRPGGDLPHPLPEPEDLPAIERELDMRLSIKDFSGIANLILEVLLVPSQEHAPRHSGGLLARRIDAIVAAAYGLHPAVTYERPLRDVWLPAHLRRDWTADTFHQLMIFAHVLGATWKTLPRPYDRLRPFYEAMARRQAARIECVVDARRDTDRVLHSRYPDDIKRRLMSAPPPPVTEDDE